MTIKGILQISIAIVKAF